MSAVSRWTPTRVAAWTALGLMLLITLAPLAVMLRTALESNRQLFESAGSVWPQTPTLDNFRRVFGLVSGEEALTQGGSGAELVLGRAVFNSLLFTGTIVVCQTLSAAMAAYAFARLRFPGRDLMFGLCVASMMVPGVVTFIPNFVLLRDLGLLNTFIGMVAPFCLMQGFSVFFLRQCFLSLPTDVEEAARLDGAGTARIFFQMVLPLSAGPLSTVAVLTGIQMWNEFFWPYLVAKDEAWQVVPVALQVFKSQTPQGQPDWTGLMAAATVAVLPTVLLLVVLGRRVVESVQFSGSK